MTETEGHWPKLLIRVPPDAKKWLAAQARHNGSSQASEVVRSIRERMDRMGTDNNQQKGGSQ